MLDALFIKKFFHIGVLEFCSIVTTHFLDWKTELSLFSSNEDFYLLLYLALVKHKEHPSETSIVINNNKTIFVTIDANVTPQVFVTS